MDVNKFDKIKHLIECWSIELINSGMVNFSEEFFLYSISGKVSCDPSVSIILSNDGEVSITIAPLTKNTDLKHIYEAERQHIIENELKKKIQELEKQLDKAKNAADGERFFAGVGRRAFRRIATIQFRY